MSDTPNDINIMGQIEQKIADAAAAGAGSHIPALAGASDLLGLSIDTNTAHPQTPPDHVHSILAEAVNFVAMTAHTAAVHAGWWHDIKTGEAKIVNVGEKLMLIVSEIGEAMEGHRKNLMDEHLPQHSSIAVELADAMIRIGDLAGHLRLNLGQALADKMAYNAVREDHKIEARLAPGGKAY